MNSSDPGNLPATRAGFTNVHVGVFGLIFAVISAGGLFGNFLVIVAVITDAKMKTVMNLLLLNLACADLANLVFCAPEWVQPIIAGKSQWLLPNFLCFSLRYLEYVSLYTSILTQVAVCIERFVAIKFPMKARLFCTRKKIKLTSLGIWTFTGLYALPYAIYHRVVHTDTWHCIFTVSPLIELWYKVAECFLFYFCPLIVIVVLYSVVSYVLWSTDENLFEGSSSEQEAESLKVRKNVVKMLIACVCLYFACYSPIQYLFWSGVAGRKIELSYNLRLFLNALAYGCSAFNPFMYTIFSRAFRSKFSELLCCNKSSNDPRLQRQFSEVRKESRGRGPQGPTGMSLSSFTNGDGISERCLKKRNDNSSSECTLMRNASESVLLLDKENQQALFKK